MSRILPILALMIAVGIFFGYVNPEWTGTLADKRAAIRSNNQALEAAAEYQTKQNQLASARNAIDSANLARVATLVPDSVDNVGLILDLNALAARSGIALTSIDVAKTDDASASSGALPAGGRSPLSSVELKLSAAGSYAGLQNFLAGVENSARLLDVTDLTVRGSDTGVYTYQMSLRLYWLR